MPLLPVNDATGEAHELVANESISKNVNNEGSRKSLYCPLKGTHIIDVLRDEYVHFGGLGAHYLAVQRIFTEVHVAAFCLINGNCRHFSHYLK